MIDEGYNYYVQRTIDDLLSKQEIYWAEVREAARNKSAVMVRYWMGELAKNESLVDMLKKTLLKKTL